MRLLTPLGPAGAARRRVVVFASVEQGAAITCGQRKCHGLDGQETKNSACSDQLEQELTDWNMADEFSMSKTWDGKSIASEPPYGATVVVYRMTSAGPEFLILHRAHQGPAYDGDWAWTPPAGARQPSETVEACARRELLEEAGLCVHVRRADHGATDWAYYSAEVGSDAQVALHDEEHDRFEWVSLANALQRCRPERVAEGIEIVARTIVSI